MIHTFALWPGPGWVDHDTPSLSAVAVTRRVGTGTNIIIDSSLAASGPGPAMCRLPPTTQNLRLSPSHSLALAGIKFARKMRDTATGS
jgi:hypothetical protein